MSEREGGARLTRRAARLLLFVLLSVVCIGCDRVTKEFATESLRGNEPVVLAGGTVRLEYAENRGAFLSLGDGMSEQARFWWLGIGTGVVLCGIVLILLLRADLRLGTWIALTLILAGGAGNLVDRLRDGYVVDFLNLRVGFVRTGIFNVADVAITAGAIWIFVSGFFRRGAGGHSTVA